MVGVFRKAGNAKRLKEIREQLNNGVKVALKDEPVILLADLLKVKVLDCFMFSVLFSFNVLDGY